MGRSAMLVQLRSRSGSGGAGVGLPQAKRSAGGVDDDAEPAHVWDFGLVSHDLCAEAGGFCGCGRDIVNQNVREPGGRSAGDGVLHHASAGSAFSLEGGVDHAATHVLVGELPVEEGGVEGFGFGDIG